MLLKETGLKEVQNRAKIRVIFSGTLEGEEKDRTGSYELLK